MGEQWHDTQPRTAGGVLFRAKQSCKAVSSPEDADVPLRVLTKRLTCMSEVDATMASGRVGLEYTMVSTPICVD